MFDLDTLPELKKLIEQCARGDSRILAELCKEVEALRGQVRAIKPRSTTAVSLVASDGGNNHLVFDPFSVQIVRVVDSYGKQLCLDAISPTTDPDELSRAQFRRDGTPGSPLGFMIQDLGVDPPTLNALSHMIPSGKAVRDTPESISPSWVLVYRDLWEWAVLYERIRRQSFATDTLIVRDGALRSKVFRGDNFIKYRKNIEESIKELKRKDKRSVYLVGIAKHSKVLVRYGLAMAITNLFPQGEAMYVRVPRDMEAKAYVWQEYARGAEAEGQGEAPKFVAGDMHFVRFGTRSGDPVWVVDILSSQTNHAPEIFGYLLADAIDGFPVPFYPRCLQKAHEYAQLGGFDFDVLQDSIFEAVRGILPPARRSILDAMRLNSDQSERRYE